jgi:hypothetical protein
MDFFQESKNIEMPFFETGGRFFNVFVNRHHPQMSKIIGCNTNVQCGINGDHIMYSTTFQTKSTQAEDSRKYAAVAKRCCFSNK